MAMVSHYHQSTVRIGIFGKIVRKRTKRAKFCTGAVAVQAGTRIVIARMDLTNARERRGTSGTGPTSMVTPGRILAELAALDLWFVQVDHVSCRRNSAIFSPKMPQLNRPTRVLLSSTTGRNSSG